jgi:hypothetical protein
MNSRLPLAALGLAMPAWSCMQTHLCLCERLQITRKLAATRFARFQALKPGERFGPPQIALVFAGGVNATSRKGSSTERGGPCESEVQPCALNLKETNAYPDRRGRERETTWTQEFRAFVAAVEQLATGTA